MEPKTTVHRWTTRTEYYDMEDGTEISKQKAIRDYDIIKTRKKIKIENYHGYITLEKECQKKRQLKIRWREE